MSDLKIGGFKNNSSSGQEYDLDLSKKPEGDVGNESQSAEGNQPQPQESQTLVEDNKEGNDPQGQQPTPNNDPNGNGGDDPQPDSSLTSTSSSEPNGGTQLELTDDVALNYLSEKLGKEIKSFDDLTSPQPTVENPLDSDPYLKKLHEWRQKTGRPIEDWIKYQKDYSSLDDIDVAREFLQHEYPNLTKDEISLELKKYQITEDDFDDQAALKKIELKKYSAKGRNTLNELVSDLGEVTQANFSPEVQQDLQIAKQYKEAAAQQQQLQQDYTQSILSKSLTTEGYELNLSDDLKINFKLSENNRKRLPELIETMPHWRNEDDSWNHQAVVNDAIKINHFDDMVKLAYEQGVNAGKETIISDTKNTTLGQPTPQDANLQDGKKGVVIEGFDDFVGNKGMKVRFKNK